jgi:hypothetical protein
MAKAESIGPELQRILERAGIDVESTKILLDLANGPGAAPAKAESELTIEGPGSPGVLTEAEAGAFHADAAAIRARLAELGLEPPLGLPARGPAQLSKEALHDLGVRLYARTAFGVLNGGSATSYGDAKRNDSMSPELFSLFRPDFEEKARSVRGQPKGLAPAFFNPDGSPGPSFLEMKFRGIAERVAEFESSGCKSPRPPLPFFQMTSQANDAELREAAAQLADSVASGRAARSKPIPVMTGTQRMVAALTHRDEGLPRRVFDRAYGKEGCVLPLPGGHGQSFSALEPVYRGLLDQGYRYAYVGNVDNLGYTVSPASLARFALSGAEAAFEFSLKTPLDVKGGILVRRPDGRLSCADIGQAIASAEVAAFEARGGTALFNCATGLFDLSALVPALARIQRSLPIRISEQDKDIGRYAQAEQNLWESMPLFERVVAFAVDKHRRFLPAKMLIDTLVTSGARLGEIEACASGGGELAARLGPYAAAARRLHAGLNRALREEYGMVLRGGRWIPR